jgi:hypothetical protein
MSLPQDSGHPALGQNGLDQMISGAILNPIFNRMVLPTDQM